MKNTGIIIEAKEELDGLGQLGYRIIRVKALKREELPDEYIDGKDSVVYYSSGSAETSPCLVQYRKTSYKYWTFVGKFYVASCFHSRLKQIRQAGDHLTKINIEAKKKLNKTVVFIDGEEQKKDADSPQYDKSMSNIDMLEYVYEDLKIAYIHKEPLTISQEYIEAILFAIIVPKLCKVKI